MQTQQAARPSQIDIRIRPLQEGDLRRAEEVRRLAFGTFIGLPDPLRFGGDTNYARTRWLADPAAALAAEMDGQLVASNFATNWGSVGFFGPLTVLPDLWDRGIAKRLLEPTMDLFSKWGTKHAGLYTFAQSPKHIALYQKFGFWPRFLTAIMSKPVEFRLHLPQWSRYSQAPQSEKERHLGLCRELTNLVYEGLDLQREILAVDSQRLGDTVLLWDEAGLAGFAVCHCGPGSEAGSGTCYIKFGAVRPGPASGLLFYQLLDACDALATAHGMTRIVAGVNLAREQAYRKMIAYGFRTDTQGVAMQKPNEPGYNRPDVYVIDDWR